MHKLFALTAGMSLVAGLAYGQQQVPQWKWAPDGVYRTQDGYGAVVSKTLGSLNGSGVVIYQVEIMETPPPYGKELRFQHGQAFWVMEWDHLGEWRPAYLCLTKPRFYFNPTGGYGGWEVDRYTSFSPCPVIPID